MKKLLLPLALSALTACAPAADGTSNDQGRLQITNTRLSVAGVTVPLTFTLTLSANLVPPPVAGGYNVEANNIYVNGLDTFVSYNYQGNVKAGGLDHILTTVATVPTLGSEMLLATSESNAVVKYGSNLYSVGAQSDSLGSPAIVQQVPLYLGLLTSASVTNTTTSALRSYAGTAAAVKGTTLYTLSGDGSGSDGGGLTMFNLSTLAQSGTTEIPDARDMSYNAAGTSTAKTTSLWVVSGKTASLNSKLYQLSDAGSIVSSIDLGASANTIAQSKSTVTVGKTMILVSKGDGGFAIYCAQDGALLASQAAVTVTGLTAANTVTNSVTAGPGLVFAANGEAGVYVYSMKSNSSTASVCTGVTLSQLGSVTLGTSPVAGVGVSANLVRYSGAGVVGTNTGTLYVAAGVGGLKVISLVESSTASDILDFN